MTTQQNYHPKMNAGTPLRSIQDGSHVVAVSNPHRMPAGGWLKEISTNENWRTTTIVQRHRDRATSPPAP